MEKVKGKDLEFWWDGAEVPIISENLSVQFDTNENTDSATPGTGKDYDVLRASRTFQIEANLYEPDGAEIASGTLTQGTRYRVTAGTITEGANTYNLGEIFESDGTGAASASNKVKPLGSKINGKSMALDFNSAVIPVTDIDFNLKYDELDSTDSSTVGDSKETEVSRADRETKITGIVRDTVADLLTTNPIARTTSLQFSSNVKIDGQMIPIAKNVIDAVKDVAKIDYSFKWIGLPTETNFGLPAGIVKPFKIILKRGTSQNKEYLGNAVITAKSAKSNISASATINYTLSINGELTENAAN